MSKNSSRRSTRSKKSKASKESNNKLWIWLAVGLIVVVGVVAGVLLIQPDTTTQLPDTISVDQAYEKYQAGTFLLDVRTPEEWIDYHAPNTTLIPLDELENRVNEVPSDQEVVVICRSGNRSQEGRDILRSAGFTQVTSMAGGLKEWSAAGYPTVSGQ